MQMRIVIKTVCDHTSSEDGRAAGEAVTLASLSLYSDIVVLSAWENSRQKGLDCTVNLHIAKAPCYCY